METSELDRLRADLESDRVERKERIGRDRDRIAQAICAFANDLPNHRAPGVIFVGVRDDGSCAGLHVDEELLLQLSAIRSDGNIQPLPHMTVQRHMVDGCELAVVVVHPADAPPVRFRGQVWIRVGPRRAIASEQEERRLTEKRRARDLPFDARPLFSASRDDLDLQSFRQEYLPSALPPDVLARDGRDLDQQLRALRFLDPDSVPTAAGVLVLCPEPTQFLPGAYVQFLRVDGDTLADPIVDQKRLDGPLVPLLRTLDETVQAHVSVGVDLRSGPLQRTMPDYPLVALQQLVRNAVMHRTYEATNAPVRVTWFRDRIEIQSPGGPFGQVDPENFGEPGVTDYRNPTLAEAMRVLGFVQRFGVGIQTARDELRRNGNPAPEFEVNERNVLVILRRCS